MESAFVRRVMMWARNSTWLFPTLGMGVGAGLALLFVAEPFGRPWWLSGLAWRASVEEARVLLATMLGVVITTLSIALSLFLLVLQNTASQYSPRLLRLFIGEPGSRVLVPVFVGTGVYCLVGVSAFGLVEDPDVEPRPALSLAMLLLVLCGAALIFQVTNTLKMVRVEQIVRRVRTFTLEVARTQDRQHRRHAEAALTASTPSGTGRTISAPSSGFVVDIDTRALLSLAEEHKLFIHVDLAIGEPVVREARLGRILSEQGPPKEAERVAEGVERAVLIGPWREPKQDIALGVRQLVDVALKALSPAVNDPSTAVESVDQLTLLLCELCRLKPSPRVLADSMGRPRVFLRALEPRDYLVLATEQLSRYGAKEPAVVLRLLRLAGEVALRVTDASDLRSTREILQQVLADAEEALPGSSRLPLLRRYAAEVERAMERREPLPPLPSLGF